MHSIEILPELKKDGRTQVVGIVLNGKDISLTFHSNLIGETDNEKLRNPDDYKSITFPIEHLKWLAPRLEGIRGYYKIEDGFDKKNF